MRYKVGDKVRVRGDLEVGKRYGNVTFISSMEKNKTFKILFARDPENYDLNDKYSLWYSSEMLRPYEFKIWCETDEEKQAVLEELEKEGYVWKSGREKPTEPTYIGFFGKKPCGLYIQNDELGWDNSEQSFHDDNTVKLTPSEFTGIDFTKKIIITKTPTGATATYGDKTVTIERDFKDASRQALAEVLCPFKVGDRVQLKTNSSLDGEVIGISTDLMVRVTGAALDAWFCFDELEPYTEPLYNAKLFCIKSGDIFKTGHIYKIIDGEIYGEADGKIYHFKDLEDVNSELDAQFMEIKGGLDE